MKSRLTVILELDYHEEIKTMLELMLSENGVNNKNGGENISQVKILDKIPFVSFIA